MPEFDTFDIAEAYWCYYCDWHAGGLTARDEARNARNGGRSIAVQLTNLDFVPNPGLTSDTLRDNARAIYDDLVARWED